jgi:hypothetical protein
MSNFLAKKRYKISGETADVLVDLEIGGKHF